MTQPATEDRVAVVTGAARGIGAATVAALRAQGLRVVAVDSCTGDRHGLAGVGYPLATRDDLYAVAGQDNGVVPVVADVRDPDRMGAAVEVALDHWGRLDVAVAAAAVIVGGAPMWDTPTADVETLWQTDVLGVWHTATAAVPRMLAGPDPSGCRFVAVASVAGRTGLFNLAAYTMAKHAVVGLVRGLAADLTGTGVVAVVVAPGATRTRMLDATAALYGLDGVGDLAANGLGRVLEPAEVAATIAHCCSRAGAALHGSVVSADGGFAG
jgi:SDR family mycofactocin-dependent oxidoreductase